MTYPLESLQDALGERYTVLRLAGEGGMATVYVAHDVKHDRDVALKILKPDIAQALGRDRFLREIKLAAKLQHPNILPVYDSGEAAGALYYVMPFVEGESLRDRLDREGQFPIDEAIQIAREVADALAYAHSHDVVHRDIKPENVMLSGGHAVVADFGIARAISGAGQDKVTQTGLAIGTPAYMSPEQASGSGQIDRRSDIYSLGCMLYEMLAGMPPFTGPSAHAVMARHSLDAVPRLKIVRETVPDAVEDAIMRALAKVPADRFATAMQFAEALARPSVATPLPRGLSSAYPAPRRFPRGAVWAGGAAVALALGWGGWRVIRGPVAGAAPGGLDPKRVAVLYFADQSRDSSLGHLADGFTEALIDQLGQVRALDVISRNGVAPYRGADVARDSIAQALAAGSLIEGGVEAVGGRVRVSVRLVDGTSGADIDRASFELPLGQLLAVRDSVVKEVARLLRQRLGEEVQLRERRAGTVSVEAWALVQRAEKARQAAEAELARGDAEGALGAVRRVDSLLAQAERADPKWMEPVVLRGRVAPLAARATRDPQARADLLRQGLLHAGRALRLAPGEAAALELRGALRYGLWRLNVELNPAQREALLDSAQADLDAAVRANPTLATAHATLSRLLYERKEVVSALLAARAAYDADAYLRDAAAILDRLFWGSHDIAQFAEARRWCAEGARRFPANWRFTECQLWMLLTPGAEVDVDQAWRLTARADSLTPAPERPLRERLRQLIVGGVLGRAGLRDSAGRVLARARTSDPEIDATQELMGYEAVMRALMGDADEAISLLKRYVATHPDHSFQRGGMLHWWWRDLERHPQFREVMRATR